MFPHFVFCLQFDGPCWNTKVEQAVKKHIETQSAAVEVVVGSRGDGGVKQLGASFVMPVCCSFSLRFSSLICACVCLQGEMYLLLSDPFSGVRRMWVGRQFPPPFLCQEVSPEQLPAALAELGL